MHWATRYIGRPWSQENDCYAFFRHIQLTHFGRHLPVIDVDAMNIRTVIRTFRDHEERSRWGQVPSPMEGDAAMLGKNSTQIHLGLWLPVDGGRVLHCDKVGGVLCQSLDSLRLNGWSHVEWYSPCN